MHLAPIALLMIQIGVVVLTSRALARLVRYLGQPTVIAEVVAGILLGPSLLGLLWPGAMAALFPAESMPGLSLVAQLGLVFFMFLVGLEFDPRLLAGRGHQSVMVSWASILAPFGLGAALAWPLHGHLAPEGVAFLPFALFMGAAMSVTAFPVLARILAERGVLRTRVGAIALSCAAVDDVSAWCILAFVVSIARASGLASGAITTALALAYIAVVWLVVRPMLARLGPRQGQALTAETVAIVFLIVLASATATELIGIHALFGAFLIGAVMPRGGGLAHALTEKLEDFVTIALLPLFFAYSGLRTRLGLVEGVEDWLTCGAIILVACAGKFGGSALAGRVTGMPWREASAVGILMNTRGLMELIVLNMGLDLGVLSPRLFTMMVIMALVTTWMTSPLLERIYPRRQMLRDMEEGEAPAPVAPTPAMVCVSDPAIVPALVAVGRHLVSGDESLLALHLVRSDRPSAYLGGGPAPADQEPLELVQEQAAALGVRVRALSYVAEDPARDIVRVAEAKSAALVVLGSHRPLLVEGELGGVVRRVLANSTADVAVLVDRGMREIRGMRVIGDDAATLAVAARLRRGGVADAADGLLVAPLGTPVPDGATALLVRPRKA
jgi:Kef-type K+ transport system membrane component KefB/nucleotide-binding universal stress UspA family protein